MSRFQWIPAIIVIAFLALVSVSPFLSEGLPLADDAKLHIYRSILLDDALRHDGSLYPRYTSGLAYGYGASLFNYFPPTSYYPVVMLKAGGLSPVNAWKATMILYVLLAGTGMFLWARQWVDETGAFIATSAYLYAPYTLFDTVTRGTSSEFAGMALLPFALWGFTRLARYGTRRDYLLAIVSYVLFIMAHNLTTLYGSLLLVAYCGFLWLNWGYSFRVLWQLASAGIFAVLITGFFWLPALTETDFVKINGVLENLEFVDVTNTLRTIQDVFALPETADPTRLQSVIPVSFHWIAVILGVLGFFLPQPPEDDEDKNSILGLHVFLFISLGIIIFTQLTVSAGLWESVRLLQYSQFAWRPMSIGSLILALLAGIGGSYLIRLIPSRTGKYISMGVLLALILLYSMPWLYRPEVEFNPQTIADAQQFEIETGQLTLSSYSEYLPAQTVQSALDPFHFQAETSRLTSRLQENEAFTIISLDEGSRRLSAELNVNEATRIVLDWLYVPGWRVRVDGTPVDVSSAGDAGLLSFDISEGQHRIIVDYAGTKTQQFAMILSLLAVAGSVSLLIIPLPLYRQSVSDRDTNNAGLSTGVMITVSVLGLLMFAVKSGWIDNNQTIFRSDRYENGIIRDVNIPLNINFNNHAQLIGAEIDEPMESGGTGEIRLYWTPAGETITGDYSSLVQLIDSQGIVIAEAGNFYPGGLATSNWLNGYYVEDVITLEIPQFTAPQSYHVVAGLFHSDNGQRIDILNESGNPTGIEAQLSVIQVERPDMPPAPEDLPPVLMTVAGFDLLVVDMLPESAQVGDEIVFSWLWRAVTPEQDFSPQLVWVGGEAVTLSSPVIDYPVADWQAGDVWRGYHRIFVPATLAEWDYPLAVQVGGQANSLNTTMTITVPERDFEMPELENEGDTLWENGIRLMGYQQNDTAIILYWQTDNLIDESLRLFVQVFNDEGQILAINDGIPDNGQRATTGWLTEEIIQTEHIFDDLPEDDYHLLIGWYNPQTGVRVQLSDADTDAFELTFSP